MNRHIFETVTHITISDIEGIGYIEDFFFFGVGEAKNSPVWQNEHRHYERPFGAVFFLLGKQLI